MASGPLTGDDSENGSSTDDDGSPKPMSETGDTCSHNRQPESGSLRLENLVKVRLRYGSKVSAKELKRKLVGELDRVRNLVRRIESKEFRNGIGGSSGKKLGQAGSMAQHGAKSIRGHVGVAHVLEKEKKMVDSGAPVRKEKVSSNGGKNSSMLFKNSSLLFKSCGDLLAKMMKHKHGWVFNKPVDVKKLQLHDYYTIVKHPMDLGTVKSRLSKNWYKSAEEFAEDVRLTFRNAMLYNPKGQDVHIMADLLLKLFEENWVSLENHYKLKRRPEMRNDVNLHKQPSRKSPAPALVRNAPPVPAPAPIRNVPPINAPASPPRDRVLQPPVPEMRTLDRSESMTKPAESNSKSNPTSLGHSGRTPVPKKPKTRVPENRPMTLAEKQKLSIDLQNLPSDKLGTVVEIIKKRNPPLSQEDDEIEVDIDAVDPETLWELDAFIADHKKGLGKNKRKAEEAVHTIHEVNLSPVAAESPKQTETVGKNFTSSVQLEKAPPSVQVEEPCSPAQVEKQGDNVSGSSSSSSSSSDTGSSSSGSDSDSSSASGSDAGH